MKGKREVEAEGEVELECWCHQTDADMWNAKYCPIHGDVQP